MEGLQGDEYFNQLVDYRNVAEGDQNVFLVEDSDLFYVAKIADGTQGVRRQRLGGAAVRSLSRPRCVPSRFMRSSIACFPAA